MSDSLDNLLQGLKAVAEPTRLRLLALLSGGELTVTEICEVIGQSQPRVSRHLKVLCEAGLLDRFREQHWVYYRVAVDGRSGALARRLLDLLPQADASLELDRERCDRVIAARVSGQRATVGDATEQGGAVARELGRILLVELGDAGVGELLDIGTGQGHLLRELAPQARHATGIDVSPDALRVARTQLYVAGLGRCQIKRGDMYRIEAADDSFDTVTMDRVLADAADPQAALLEAARALRASGRLAIVEDFEALASSGTANPLATLREWLTRAGFSCLRLHPVDTAAGHLVIAIGAPASAAHAAA